STSPLILLRLFSFIAPLTTHIYTLSLHDALPIYSDDRRRRSDAGRAQRVDAQTQDCGSRRVAGVRRAAQIARDLLRIAHFSASRSEEHTSELQSRFDLVCRLLLEKKKKNKLRSYL